jgi:uncharacterized protein (DUF983 family)
MNDHTRRCPRCNEQVWLGMFRPTAGMCRFCENEYDVKRRAEKRLQIIDGRLSKLAKP